MRISVDSGKCTGCNSCELACYFARAHTFNPKKARIKVVPLDYLGFSNPVVCLLCKKPRCVEVCPTGALSQTEVGTIQVDEEKCVGCEDCLEVCVFKGMEMHDDIAEVNQERCLGCGRCDEVCPNDAISIIFNDPNDIEDLINTLESYADVT